MVNEPPIPVTLLPCPFCGKRPVIWKSDPLGNFAIECEGHVRLGWYHFEEQAIDSWNTRVNPPPEPSPRGRIRDWQTCPHTAVRGVGGTWLCVECMHVFKPATVDPSPDSSIAAFEHLASGLYRWDAETKTLIGEGFAKPDTVPCDTCGKPMPDRGGAKSW